MTRQTASVFANDKILRAEITVIGRVQGVGFRYSLMNMAKFLNLSGYVRNMPDGSVYAEAEGEPVNLEELVKWCRKGPARAIVERTEVAYHPPAGYRGFTIR